MRIFKTAWFNRFARKNELDDETLAALAYQLEEGMYDADLGGGVYKKRLARQGNGSSSGFRILICFRQGDRAFFVYGFAKSMLGNIDQGELRDLKKLAKVLLNMDWQTVEDGLRNRMFFEVRENNEKGIQE